MSHPPERLRTPALAAAAAVLALAGPLVAQETQAPDRWDVRLELGFNGASGNSSFSILRTGARATRVDDDRYELDLQAAVRYGTNEERTIANDARASVKFDWRPSSAFSPFLFVDAGRDKIRRLDFQASGGAGAKWTIARQDGNRASLSAATLFDYQNFTLDPGAVTEASEARLRWSFRLKGERRLGEGTSLEHLTVFQPVWDHASDYVVTVTNSVSTSLLGNVSLGVEHQYLRDSVPPPGAGRDDQRFSVLFRLSL